MIVLVDIGNTRIKYCTANKGKPTKIKAVDNSRVNMSFFEKQFQMASQVVVACVSKQELAETLATWCKTHNILFQQVSSEAKKNLVKSPFIECL